MKVKLTAKSKKIVTVAEMPAVKHIMSMMREDPELIGYAKLAARIAANTNADWEILKADAEIAKNNRVWNAYGDATGNLDVWLTIYAFNRHNGFYSIGAYLSDLWKSTGNNANELQQYMCVCAYTE